MKVLLVFVLVLTGYGHGLLEKPTGEIVQSNAVDRLETVGDVNTFLLTQFPELKYGGGLLDDTKAVPEGLGKNSFHKIDVNGDGLTDLVVDGSKLMAAVDMGDDVFRLFDLDLVMIPAGQTTLIGIDRHHRPPVLSIGAVPSDPNVHLRMPPVQRRAVFLFGGFFEVNDKPQHLSVKSIRFVSSGCFGSCPQMDITIEANGAATYNAKRSNPGQEGLYTTRLDRSTLERIMTVIDYIDIPHLNNAFYVPWTDDQAVDIEITYGKGQVKKIHDYGKSGTYGLSTLYAELFALRTGQKWTKLKS